MDKFKKVRDLFDNQRKCCAPDCKNKVDSEYLFCSFTCAAYAGCFDVKTGFKEDKIKELRQKMDGSDTDPSLYQNIPCDVELKIEWCSGCQAFFVRCPRCGNNSCNAAFGEDGNCPVCEKTYELMYGISENKKLDQAVDDMLHWEERYPKDLDSKTNKGDAE